MFLELGDTTLRKAGRPPNSSSKEQTNHSILSGEQEQCPSYPRTPFSDITNLNCMIILILIKYYFVFCDGLSIIVAASNTLQLFCVLFII